MLKHGTIPSLWGEFMHLTQNRDNLNYNNIFTISPKKGDARGNISTRIGTTADDILLPTYLTLPPLEY